ncbi:MAG: 3-deoxy-D-manno-octulosonate 8-phosphate phosphatase (KDO 8-P phosphatase) [Gammaproteobacteria bacterium]|jgi:3-deoxy-D-manno-octulosonate 8-phosphate phosphatase (KDO 8-P phosphatase)|tara:strand:- start:981 stop:1490 length:510 start_codon:yes stop_codon:yes gene_type:complete
MTKKGIWQRAAGIKLLVLDVDGVLTDGRLLFDAEGREQKVFHARDGYGMRALMRYGTELAIISGRKSRPVEARMKELDVPYVYLGQSDKVATLNKLIQELGIKLQQVAYVGDDIPDLACMQAVGLSIAVHDAHQTVRKQADWRTTLPGGRGAVREVCDLLIDAQQVVQS